MTPPTMAHPDQRPDQGPKAGGACQDGDGDGLRVRAGDGRVLDGDWTGIGWIECALRLCLPRGVSIRGQPYEACIEVRHFLALSPSKRHPAVPSVTRGFAHPRYHRDEGSRTRCKRAKRVWAFGSLDWESPSPRPGQDRTGQDRAGFAKAWGKTRGETCARPVYHRGLVAWAG